MTAAAGQRRDADQPPEEADDVLPAEGDPYWEDLTGQALDLLRRLRTAHRRERLRTLAYAGYVTVLLVAVYVVPYVTAAVAAPEPVAGPGSSAVAPVPLAAVAVGLFVLVAAVRDAAWRGPALLDVAAAAWLLPAPILRGRLLRPRLRLALASGIALGAVLGGLGGVLLRLLAGGSSVLLAASGAGAGASVGLLAVAAGGLAQSAGGRAGGMLRRAGGALWLPPALLAAVAAAWWADPAGPGGTVGRAVTPVVLWSGPWGWAVHPLAVSVPGAPGPGVLWPLGTAAAAGVGVSLAVLADRRIDRLPGRLLRARAASVSGVTASLWTLQPRRARALIRAAQGWTPSARLRLPVPRRRVLLLPWRDATALLRAPSRLLWGLVWLALAVALFRAGAAIPVVTRTAAGRAVAGQHLALTLPGLAALYLAAAQLVEPARLDADDPRAPRGLPLSARTLARWHAVVPLGVLLAGLGVGTLGLLAAGALGLGTAGPGTAGGLVSGAAGPLPAGIAEVALAAVPLTGAALVSAYRGDVPLSVFAGASTPMGDTGPLQAVFWYLRGPLLASALLLPLALGLAPVPDALVASAVMLAWAGTRAEAVLRG